MADLIERTRMAAKILRDIGGQSAMAETVEEAAAALEAAREDGCVALVADIRFACGDNGKRMQPELVEFIRELAVDAERWRTYEAGGGEGTSHVCVKCGHPYWPDGENEDCPKCGHDGSAIDQARGKGGAE